jgi:hypothetical protein
MKMFVKDTFVDLDKLTLFTHKNSELILYPQMQNDNNIHFTIPMTDAEYKKLIMFVKTNHGNTNFIPSFNG